MNNPSVSLLTNIDCLKNIINKTKSPIDEDLAAEIQGRLSKIREDACSIESHVFECQTRQNVYAEVAEKILDRVLRKDY